MLSFRLRLLPLIFGISFCSILIDCSSAQGKEDGPQNNSNSERNSAETPASRSADLDLPAQTVEDGKCEKGDCENGSGTYAYANGDKYDGTFKNGLRDGHGKFAYKNGDQYEGNFAEDKKDGFGTYVFANGTVLEGIFSGGALKGKSKLTFSDGSVLEVEFTDDNNSGPGKFTRSDGTESEECSIQSKTLFCPKE